MACSAEDCFRGGDGAAAIEGVGGIGLVSDACGTACKCTPGIWPCSHLVRALCKSCLTPFRAQWRGRHESCSDAAQHLQTFSGCPEIWTAPPARDLSFRFYDLNTTPEMHCLAEGCCQRPEWKPAESLLGLAAQSNPGKTAVAPSRPFACVGDQLQMPVLHFCLRKLNYLLKFGSGCIHACRVDIVIWTSDKLRP